jgi:hypothetical protein
MDLWLTLASTEGRLGWILDKDKLISVICKQIGSLCLPHGCKITMVPNISDDRQRMILMFRFAHLADPFLLFVMREEFEARLQPCHDRTTRS